MALQDKTQEASLAWESLLGYFQAEKPLQKQVTETTDPYLSTIIDLYNREIAAYMISETQDTDFVLGTLNQLELEVGALLLSNQGPVYTSRSDYHACVEKGITRFMSRKGTPRK